MKINNKENLESPSAGEIVIEVMRHFGYRRNYQVAEYFDVTPQTLSGWIKSGEIPPKHLIKYSKEIAERKNVPDETIYNRNNIKNISDTKNEDFSWLEAKQLLFKSLRLIIGIPVIIVSLVSIYVFYFADQVYTSKAKVLPISEDGSSSSSFSGFASQLGLNMPLSMGGKVPWDEIYPEILKSGDLLESMLNQKYNTKKYGLVSLKNILIEENSLNKYDKLDQTNRVIDKLREMIKISKDRTSPIVNINILAFEPVLASEISKDLILRSSLIQRQLKTNRVKNKRLFIEERLKQVSVDMKRMEAELRQFRENNRNLSSSPSLSMKLQEMGREVDLQNSLYITLKTQYEKAKIDEVGRDDMVQQIDGPSIPTRLTSPKRMLSITMALFFGLFFSFFTIYIREQYLH